MKAIVFSGFGTPDILELKNVEKPVPADNEVLVKVHACSINDWDWGLLQGKPYVNRLSSNFKNPRQKIPGSDIAGVVEAVGNNVSQFKPGDTVFGDLSSRGWGGFAEFVCAPEDRLLHKPENLSFEQAAAIPQAAVLAMQGLVDHFKLEPGQDVLINGAGGGTGSFAIQMAKAMGAEVTAVDSAEKFETMQNAGADHLIDYQMEDFTANGQQFDLVLDLMGFHSLFANRKVVKPGGSYIIVGGDTGLILKIFLFGPLLSLLTSRKVKVLLHKPNKHMNKILNLIEAGQVKPVIDDVYPIEKTADAFCYFAGKHTKGKVIISMETEVV